MFFQLLMSQTDPDVNQLTDVTLIIDAGTLVYLTWFRVLPSLSVL